MFVKLRPGVRLIVRKDYMCLFVIDGRRALGQQAGSGGEAQREKTMPTLHPYMILPSDRLLSNLPLEPARPKMISDPVIALYWA
jgi:hypothetical protein